MADLWLAVAEEHRHEVLLDATDQFRALLREIVNAEYPGQDNMWAATSTTKASCAFTVCAGSSNSVRNVASHARRSQGTSG